MIFILFSAGAYYFNKIIGISHALGETAPPIISLVISYVILIVIASIIIMAAIAGTSGREANQPADERDRLIIDKAGHWSGYILAAGALAGIFNYSVLHDGNLLFHIVFASLMLSQIGEYVFQIILYRRGV
jgi:hypothetical protein